MNYVLASLRSKIFSRYIGQKVQLCQSKFSEDQDDRTFTLNGVVGSLFFTELSIPYEFDSINDCLLLKDLSKISSEDAIGIAKLIYAFHLDEIKDITHPGIEEKGRQFIRAIKNGDVEFKRNIMLTYEVYQYLQELGYALPQTVIEGSAKNKIVKTYSVEQLIEFGIIKLI